MQDAQPFRGDSDKHSHDSFCTETELQLKLRQILSDRFTNGVQNRFETIKIQAPALRMDSPERISRLRLRLELDLEN